MRKQDAINKEKRNKPKSPAITYRTVGLYIFSLFSIRSLSTENGLYHSMFSRKMFKNDFTEKC